MTRRILFLLAPVALGAAILLQTTPLRADDVDVGARTKVILGKTKPAVLVTPNKRVNKIELNLTRDDGKKVKVAKRKPKIGKKLALEFDQEMGEHDYKGELVVFFPGGTEAVMPINFKVEVTSGEFPIKMSEADLKLEENTMTVTVGCEVDRLEVEIDGEDGVLDKVVSEHHGAPPNTPLTVRWDQPAGKKVLRVVVKPVCSNGIFREQHFFPWKYPVPHDDVHFASGSAEIPVAEQPKMDKAHAQVSAALRKYSKWGKPSLYVVGHTDSVASRSFNRDLSRRRARSIARYFVSKGLKVPVFYIGFGEEAPAVETPDETDEPRNRRAEYIISVNEPRVEIQGFDGRWTRAR